MSKYWATINNMGNFKYTNATTRTVYDEATENFIDKRLQTEFVEIKAPKDAERSIRFRDHKNNLKAYMFYHSGAGSDGTVGLYDAVGPRAVFRTILGSAELTFVKHLIPENALNLGSSSKKWANIYQTGSIIKSYVSEPRTEFNAVEELNSMNFSKKGLVKSTRTIEDDYNESEIIMTLGKSLQIALDEINKLKEEVEKLNK